jgi:enoyl-CoA hydratase/carnithine racemase
MEFETLLYDEDEGVATITLNRPEVLNAFDQQMQDELRDVWLGLRTNDDVRAVILTGAGDKAFCAGIDREEAIAEDYLANEENRNKMQSQVGPVSTPFMYNDPGVNINPKMNDLWKPVVAAVNGIACGGALYLLGESDIIIAADHATFFDPHVTYGMVAGFESVHLLQKLPLGEVLRMMLLGAMWVARAIASAPVMAIQGTLRAIWMTHEVTRREALSQVSTYVALGTLFDNIAEGQETFQGIRERPEWKLR